MILQNAGFVEYAQINPGYKYKFQLILICYERCLYLVWTLLKNHKVNNCVCGAVYLNYNSFCAEIRVAYLRTLDDLKSKATI